MKDRDRHSDRVDDSGGRERKEQVRNGTDWRMLGERVKP